VPVRGEVVRAAGEAGLERRLEVRGEAELVEVAVASDGDQPDRLVLEAHQDARITLDPHRIFRAQRRLAGDVDRVLHEVRVIEADGAMARHAGGVHVREIEATAVLRDEGAVVHVHLVGFDDEPARQETR